MADSIREKVLKAMVATLNASPPVGVPVTTRSRMESVTPDLLPTCRLFPEKDSEEAMETGLAVGPARKHTMDVTIEVRAKGDAMLSADQAADPILQWIDAKLNETTYPEVWRSCEIVDTSWDQELEEYAYVLVTVVLRVAFLSLRGDATKWS